MMHVFFFGRPSLDATAAVQAVLHDWSAVGLVGPSVWIDSDGDPRSGLLIDQGRARPIDLPSWLPRNPGEIRFITVQVLTDPAGVVAANRVQEVARVLRLSPGTVSINLLVPVDQVSALPAEAVFDSQINLLVQPVDGSGPLSVTEPLTESSPTFAMHAAAAAATVAGLWVGVQAGPLDQERPWSGTGVAVGRSYFRKLEATPIVDRLGLEVFGAEGSLPVTRSTVGEPLGLVAPGAQTVAAESAGQAVLDKHQRLTRFRPPTAFAEPAKTRLSFAAAVRLFLSFIGKALVGSPRAWVQSMVDNTKAKIGTVATSYLFGDESRYAVVLGGLDQGGSAREDQATALQQAALSLLGTLAPGSEPPAVAAPELWDDTIKTAASLVDGGNPPANINLPSQGTARLVIDDPLRICSAPGSPAFLLPTGVPGAEFGPIAVNDPYHALQVQRVLDVASNDSRGTQGRSGGGAADRQIIVHQTRSELSNWLVKRRSTTWSISAGLAIELDRARAMQADMLTPAENISEDDLRAPIAAQRSARRWIFFWLGMLLVLLAVTGTLYGRSFIGWQLALGIGLLILIGCFFGALFSFMRSQRALFQALHRLDVAAARRAWLREHAVTVTLEVIRLAGLYRQSRAWADVVAEYVHDPFGSLPAASADGPVPGSLAGELPLAMSLASAHFSPELHEPVVYQARARMLRPGWLAEQIQRRRALVLAEVTRRTGRDLENRLSSDVDLSAGGPVLSFLEGLRDPSLRSRTREVAISRLVEAVAESGTQDRLLPAVRIDAGAIAREQSWQQLTAELLTPSDLMAHEGFSATGVTNGSGRVARSFLALVPADEQRPPFLPMPTTQGRGREQLDRLVVRWDLSRPVPLDDLSYFGDVDPGPIPDPDHGSIIDVRS